MPSFKKIISAFCAASMVVTSVAIPVLADEDLTEAPADDIVIAEAESDIMPLAVTEVDNNFNSYEAKEYYIQIGKGSDPDPVTEIEGVILRVGNSNNSPSITGVGIEDSAGPDGSKALVIKSGEYSSLGRGPRVQLVTPDGASGFMATMDVKVEGSQQFYYSDSYANADHATAKMIPIEDNNWHVLKIEVAEGVRNFYLDDIQFDNDSSSVLPVIWGHKDGAARGSTYKGYIDNLKITPLSDMTVVKTALASINLTKYTNNSERVENEKVIKTGDFSYNVGGNFSVDLAVAGYTVDWVMDGSYLTRNRKEITVASVDSDTTTTLTAKVTVGNQVVSQDFKLKLLTSANFAEEVAKVIDLTEVNGNVNLAISKYAGSEYDYTAIYGFNVPTTLKGAKISWVSSDSSVSVSNSGVVNFSAVDKKDFTLTATVNYNGGLAEPKEIKITVPAERVFYNEDFEGWSVGRVVSLASTESSFEKPGYAFTSATRADGGDGNHNISIANSSTAGIGKYINVLVSQYPDRAHTFNLTRCTTAAGFEKDLKVSFNINMTDNGSGSSATPTVVYLQDDGDSIAISRSISDKMVSGTWYNMELIVYNESGKYTLTIRDLSGNLVDVVTGSTDIKKITGFSGGSVNHNFSIDKLYVSTGTIPEINSTGKNLITSQTDDGAVIANVSNANDIEISTSGNIPASAVAVENDAVVVHTTNASDDYKGTVTITAKSDITVKSEIDIVVGTDQSFANAAAASIEPTGDAITKEGNSYIFNGDEAINLPKTYYGAAVSWEDPSGAINTATGKLTKLPDGNTITLTATVNYNGKTAKQTFTIDLKDYKALVNNIIAESQKAAVVPYTNSVVKGVVTADIFADNAVIWNNVSFPSTTSVDIGEDTYQLATTWTVEKVNEDDPTYLSSAGVISVPDTDPHKVKITRTVEYKPNGSALKSDTQPKTVDVQFNAADAEKYLIDENVGQLYLDDEAWANRNEYLKAMVYDYVVKFDKALVAKYDVPKSATSNFELNTDKGVFGSDISWRSSLGTVISIDGSTAKVTQPSNSTTVTLTADIEYKTASDKQEFRVAVGGTGSGSSGGGGGFSGGSSNGGGTRGGTSSPVIGNTGFVSVDQTSASDTNPNPSGFTDLDSVSWALTAINNLCVYGVVNGKAPGLFCPNDNVTRAEFAKILVGAFNIPTVSVGSATFTDVPRGHWASAYVETAYQKGIITGYDNGAFDPDAYVTRQDMAVMVQRAASVMGYSLSPVEEAIEFTDAANIASYAQEAVSTLQQADIVNGVGDGAFEPLSTSTRAQACQMIYNVFN